MAASNEGEEVIVKGKDPFKDSRGTISNYELPESVNFIGLITSARGTIRANHYHPHQEQKVLVISGSYVSVYKDLARANSPLKHHLAQAGDLVITPPGIAHAMIFAEDTIFVNLVTGDRHHDKFGQHTIPHRLVDEGDVERYLSTHRTAR